MRIQKVFFFSFILSLFLPIIITVIVVISAYIHGDLFLFKAIFYFTLKQGRLNIPARFTHTLAD